MFVSRSFIYQQKLTRWLLTITLFFSLLTIPGGSTYFSNQQPLASLTELVIPVYSSSQKWISLKRAAQLCYKKHSNYYRLYLFQLNQIIIRHNQLYYVRLAAILQQHFYSKTYRIAFPLKTIPACSKTDPLNARFS